MAEIRAYIVQPFSYTDMIFSITSLIISCITIVIAVNTYKANKEHNRNSVRPILEIALGDYENDLFVRIENSGVCH